MKIDPDRLTVWETVILEREFDKKMSEFGEAELIAGTVWLIARRDNPDVTVEEAASSVTWDDLDTSGDDPE